MYHQRVKIFALFVAAVLTVCVIRLAQMQLVPDATLQEKIEQLRLQQTKTLETARGRIIDRNGNILALDVPGFELHIGYELSCFADERVQKAKLLIVSRREDAADNLPEVEKQIEEQNAHLERVVQRLAFFGPTTEEIELRLDRINNRIWNLRRHLAWKRNYPDSNDFTTAQSDPNTRLLLTAKVDVAEMHEAYRLLDLETEDDVFDAQLEFADVNGIYIVPENRREYPFGDAACQIIGWVRPEHDAEIFTDDPLLSYTQGELAGYSGVEYVCEEILRGRRGREIYNIDKELVGRTETQVGDDIHLSIDINLQSVIQEYLADCNANTNCDTGLAAVVIDVATGDILSMVSMPVFNLKDIRYDFPKVLADPNHPLLNRTIESHYPPGSVAKPLILIAGLEEGKISAQEVIECPAEKAPQYWPNCWIFNRYRTGHSLSWTNNARNAIRGSCNIYFSRLAGRLEPIQLQKWLFNFGYGHRLPLESLEVINGSLNRSFRQVAGYISSSVPDEPPQSLADAPVLKKTDLRWFGIGQGNFRVTPLQVANAMAVIARKGLYKPPHLIIENDRIDNESVSLNISPFVLSVVYDGMSAVVTEYGGTAYSEFQPMLDYFDAAGVKIYGKTGSTQAPEHAWFGGFAKDNKGRSIAIAIVVEGGQHGSSDAAPLARAIIQLCIESGYLGEPVEYYDEETN